MLQARYERGTKDSDIFETTDLDVETKPRLLELAGPGTDVIDVVVSKLKRLHGNDLRDIEAT